MQEQFFRAQESLRKIEEDRDDARLVIKDYEEQYKRLQTDNEQFLLDLVSRDQQARATRLELSQLDESIRLTAERNRQLRESIVSEETKIRALAEANEILEAEQLRLEVVAASSASLRRSTEEQVMASEGELANTKEELAAAANERAQLELSMKNLKLHAKTELEDLERSLLDEKKRNTELLMQLRHNEIAEKRMTADHNIFLHQMEEEQRELMRLTAILDSSASEQESYVKHKTELERKLEMRRAQNAKTKELIDDAQLQVNRMREAFNETGRALRDSSTNIYALTDQLRMLQLQRKTRVDITADRRRLIDKLDKESQRLAQKLAIETEAHTFATAELRKSQQLVNLLKKKLKQLDEAALLAQRAAEKADRDLVEAKDKGEALTVQNAYLASRIEASEEDIGTVKTDVRAIDKEGVGSVEQRKAVERKLSDLMDELDKIEQESARLQADLDYVKREDLLDDTGRVKPLLIEEDANKSGLVGKLRVNEFLIKAQREPKQAMSLLIEKIAQILELIHGAQVQSDQYLSDLNRSNGYVTQIRDKNRVLYDDINTLETFRSQALVRFIANSLLSLPKPNLYLASLGYSYIELNELVALLESNPEQAAKVERVSLRDNKLDVQSVAPIKDIISAALYLRELDLRENNFSDDDIHAIYVHLQSIDGITGVSKDDNRIIASSGPQLRLLMLVGNQTVPVRPDTAAPVVGIAALDQQAAQFLGSPAGAVHGGIEKAK